MFVPEGTMELAGGFPVSLQDMIGFCAAPDTLCQANFRLSLWDDNSHQFLRNLLFQDFLHRQGHDDFVAALEERFDLLQRVRRIIE